MKKKFECEFMCIKQFIKSVSVACEECIKRYEYPVTKEQSEEILKILLKK